MSMFKAATSNGLLQFQSDYMPRWDTGVGSAVLAFVTAGAVGFCRAVVKEFRARRAMAEIARMDHHMLRDLGVVDSDVERAVRYGRV
jgi:hypothetical protein